MIRGVQRKTNDLNSLANGIEEKMPLNISQVQHNHKRYTLCSFSKVSSCEVFIADIHGTDEFIEIIY